jgi:hypothetical protein
MSFYNLPQEARLIAGAYPKQGMIGITGCTTAASISRQSNQPDLFSPQMSTEIGDIAETLHEVWQREPRYHERRAQFSFFFLT